MRRALFCGVLLLAGCEEKIPAKYDHLFAGHVVVLRESPEKIDSNSKCQTAWDLRPDYHIYACSWHWFDQCRMILPPVNDPQEPELRRIETANCNGWHDAEARK